MQISNSTCLSSACRLPGTKAQWPFKAMFEPGVREEALFLMIFNVVFILWKNIVEMRLGILKFYFLW